MIAEKIKQIRAEKIAKADLKFYQHCKNFGTVKSKSYTGVLVSLIFIILVCLGMIGYILYNIGTPDKIVYERVIQKQPIIYNVTNYAVPEMSAECVKVENQFGQYSLHCERW
jgi:hypothetical protein